VPTEYSDGTVPVSKPDRPYLRYACAGLIPPTVGASGISVPFSDAPAVSFIDNQAINPTTQDAIM
jgi:hypothetical protein